MLLCKKLLSLLRKGSCAFSSSGDEEAGGMSTATAMLSIFSCLVSSDVSIACGVCGRRMVWVSNFGKSTHILLRQQLCRE